MAGGKKPEDVPMAGHMLRYSTYAFARLEEETGQPWKGYLDGLQSSGAETAGLLKLVWAGLQYHHPEMTVRDVADLFDAIEDPAIVTDAITKALGIAMPKGDDAAPDDEGEAPGELTAAA